MSCRSGKCRLPNCPSSPEAVVNFAIFFFSIFFLFLCNQKLYFLDNLMKLFIKVDKELVKQNLIMLRTFLGHYHLVVPRHVELNR